MLFFIISSGDPSTIILPPFSPPSAPRSIQSEHFKISKLCSMTITVLPLLVILEELILVCLHRQNVDQ